METRASYVTVGTFMLVLTVALVVFALWLSKTRFDTELKRYDVYFTGVVTGLNLGSSVTFRGVPVGEVVAIGVDPENVERVLVTIEMPAEVPVLEDTVASVQRQGFTGIVSVMLTGGTRGARPLEPPPGRERPVIASRPSELEQLITGAPELLESVSVLAARASAVLNPKNQVAFAETLDSVRIVTGALAERSDDIQLLIHDAAGTMANMRDASMALERLADQLSAGSTRLVDQADATLVAVEDAARGIEGVVAANQEDLSALIVELRQLAHSVTGMADEIQGVVAENRIPLRDFSNSGLYELSGFLIDARALIDELSRMTQQVERDPARFIFGDQQEGYEPRG